MFSSHQRLECKKKPKPAKPGAPPANRPNRAQNKARVPHNPAPPNHTNKIRQHYTRVQRG
jgi:hypothetical protein